MPIVIIKKDGKSYICQAMPGKYKCGKCLRGNINGVIADRCRVCGAIVSDISDSKEPRVGNHVSPFGIGA